MLGDLSSLMGSQAGFASAQARLWTQIQGGTFENHIARNQQLLMQGHELGFSPKAELSFKDKMQKETNDWLEDWRE